LKKIAAITLVLILMSKAYAQNVGINVPSPSEQLEVGGVIYTNQGGVKFPDQTIQTTAAVSSTQNPNSLARKQPYLTFPTTSITDTFEIIKIIEGGASVPGAGIADVVPFKLIVNLEKSIHQLFQAIAQGTVLQKATIHFPQETSPTVYKTYELRTVFVTGFANYTDYLGQNNYGHLVELTLNFGLLEIRNFSPNSCYCWSFISNTPCTCD
jgi:Type VI secretion system effector, Hcp